MHRRSQTFNLRYIQFTKTLISATFTNRDLAVSEIEISVPPVCIFFFRSIDMNLTVMKKPITFSKGSVTFQIGQQESAR